MPTFGTLRSCAKPARSRADEVGRFAFYAIVGDAWDLRRHHKEPAGRKGTSEVHQPRTIHAHAGACREQ